MKIGGHYFLLSWLRQQAQKLGADEAILLNDRDRVCEATGTAVFLYTNDELVTPPISDGALPSITAKLVIKLATELGIPISVRSVHRTELTRSRAVFLAGTLDELRPVTSIDGLPIRTAVELSPVSKLFEAFSEICRTETHSGWGMQLQV
jgi:branched-chain amino acid aminotransferase